MLVELKAVKTLLQFHVAQVLGYLKSTRMEHALLMNSGGPKFQIRKYAYSQNALDMTPDH